MWRRGRGSRIFVHKFHTASNKCIRNEARSREGEKDGREGRKIYCSELM